MSIDEDDEENIKLINYFLYISQPRQRQKGYKSLFVSSYFNENEYEMTAR